MKLDALRNADLARECLNLSVQCVLADNVEPKVAAAIGEDARGSKQRALILDPVEAGDVHEPRLLARQAANRRSYGPTLEVDSERNALRLHAKPRDQLADWRARGRDAGRTHKHGALQEAPAQRNDSAVADVAERHELAAGHVDEAGHAEQSSRRDGQRAAAPGPK